MWARQHAWVGAPHAAWGRAPVAHVVLRPGHVASPDDLIAFCRDRLAGYKVPTRVVFADALPRNAAGKLQRHRLTDKV